MHNPLLTNVDAKSQPSQKYGFIFTILIISFFTLFFLHYQQIGMEFAAGGNEWNFWQRIKASPWYRRQKCEAPEPCPGSSHTCGDAMPIFNQFAAEFREKQCFAYAHSWEADPPPDTLVSTVSSGVSLNTLKAKVVTDFFTFLAQYKSRNILMSFAIHPDHVFLVEFDSGSFRIYQSWMNSFDLEYWSGVEKEICEKTSNPSIW